MDINALNAALQALVPPDYPATPSVVAHLHPPLATLCAVLEEAGSYGEAGMVLANPQRHRGPLTHLRPRTPTSHHQRLHHKARLDGEGGLRARLEEAGGVLATLITARFGTCVCDRDTIIHAPHPTQATPGVRFLFVDQTFWWPYAPTTPAGIAHVLGALDGIYARHGAHKASTRMAITVGGDDGCSINMLAVPGPTPPASRTIHGDVRNLARQHATRLLGHAS